MPTQLVHGVSSMVMITVWLWHAWLNLANVDDGSKVCCSPQNKRRMAHTVLYYMSMKYPVGKVQTGDKAIRDFS
jgi:hypothetical protein